MSNNHPLDINTFNLITYSLADPAAGADFAFPCPSNTRLQIISVHLKLSTSATVSNRHVRIQGTDGTTIFCRTAPYTTVPASQNIYYTFSLLGQYPHSSTIGFRFNTVLSDQFFLQPGESLVSSTAGLVAGDQLSLIYIRAKLWTLPY